MYDPNTVKDPITEQRAPSGGIWPLCEEASESECCIAEHIFKVERTNARTNDDAEAEEGLAA